MESTNTAILIYFYSIPSKPQKCGEKEKKDLYARVYSFNWFYLRAYKYLPMSVDVFARLSQNVSM